MNCDQAREELIDLVYGELEPGEANAVREHLAGCPMCQTELDSLRLARSALARYAAGEPGVEALRRRIGLAADQRGAAGGGRAVRGRGQWRRGTRMVLASGAAVAAAALIFLAIVILPDRTLPRAEATELPVEIKRIGVSLTILSEPEDRPNGPYGFAPRQQALVMQSRQQTLQIDQIGMANNGPWTYYGQWTGLALVRDQRIVRHLKAGVTEVRYTDVPAAIMPDSVRLRSLDAPDGLTILEQNYQYDLASADAVLKRYLDKPVTIAFKGGDNASGVLLSFDGQTLVIRPPGEGPRNVDRRQVAAVAFDKLPDGLLTRPTLQWRLRNTAAADQQFEVAYLTGGLTWRADYVLKLHVAQPPSGINVAQPPSGMNVAQPPPAVSSPSPSQGEGWGEGPAPQPPSTASQSSDRRGRLSHIDEIVDTADLVGYATVANNSGVTYEDAQLKLLAGDVNIIRPPDLGRFYFGWTEVNGGTFSGTLSPQFAEKSFFEYHLYTLGRATTLRSSETKQIGLVSGSGLKLKRGYVYDPRGNPTAAQVVSELKNSEENGLGKPLPKGVVRLYAPDPTGEQTYVSQTTIDHTPKDETLRLPWGYAFDIACSHKETNYTRNGSNQRSDQEFSLRNHKDYDVTITVIVAVPKSAYQAKCDRPWHVREVGVVEVPVAVKANATEVVKFSCDFNPLSGGGLESPYDQ